MKKEKLSQAWDSRHSSMPASPIKRATLKIAVHVKYWYANFRLSIVRTVLLCGFLARLIYKEFQLIKNNV